MLLLRTAIAFRSPLFKRLDQVLRQVTYYELCHRSFLRRLIRQLYRFDGLDASIDSITLNRPPADDPFELRALGHSIGWRESGCDERTSQRTGVSHFDARKSGERVLERSSPIIMRLRVGNIVTTACGSWWDGRQYRFSADRIVALIGQLNTAAYR